MILEEIFLTLRDMDRRYGDEEVKEDLKTFYSRMRNIKSKGQFRTFLQTAGSSIAARPKRGRLSVQPLSVARRTKIKGGSRALKRLGRPPITATAKVFKKKAKKHKLSDLYWR